MTDAELQEIEKLASQAPKAGPTPFTLGFHLRSPIPGQAVFRRPPCGCKVVGNGTDKHPMELEVCPRHRAAPALATELLGARRLLRDLEWNGCDQQGFPTCPSCDARPPDDGGKGHRPDCALAAALR